jgi:hypothetical protein
VGISKFLKRPGERISILAFDNNCTTIQELDGFIRDGQLIQEKLSKRAIEVNEMIPLVRKDKKGKNISLVYPVDLETSQGVRFKKNDDLVNLFINPALIGNAIDSDIIKNALALKPMVWQIALAGIMGLVLGLLVGLSL